MQGRVTFAPFFRVTFADFWLADQLNSLVPVLLDFEYFVCYYLGSFYDDTGTTRESPECKTFFDSLLFKTINFHSILKIYLFNFFSRFTFDFCFTSHFYSMFDLIPAPSNYLFLHNYLLARNSLFCSFYAISL